MPFSLVWHIALHCSELSSSAKLSWYIENYAGHVDLNPIQGTVQKWNGVPTVITSQCGDPSTPKIHYSYPFRELQITYIRMYACGEHTIVHACCRISVLDLHTYTYIAECMHLPCSCTYFFGVNQFFSGKATSTLYEKLNECINSNLNYSGLSGKCI